MRSIMLHIFKYLMWALLIIAVLLYMEGYDIQQQAAVLLTGVVAIDVVFAVAELIYRIIAKHRKKKNAKVKSAAKPAAKPAAKKSRSAGESVKEAVKETGTAIMDAAGGTWDAIKEKSSEVGIVIREKLSGESGDN